MHKQSQNWSGVQYPLKNVQTFHLQPQTMVYTGYTLAPYRAYIHRGTRLLLV